MRLTSAFLSLAFLASVSMGIAASLPKTAQPSISPPGGAITGPTTVTITDSTPGAAIYYDAHAYQPTTSSTPYRGPITVVPGQSITAIAIAPGHSLSDGAVATFSMVQTATPVLSPPGGVYNGAVTVTITCDTPGVTLYYTVGLGYAPTTSSPRYTGPITVSATASIEVLAVAPGRSSVGTGATYVIQPPLPTATPTFSPPPGGYGGASQAITVSDATAGAAIYATTDGSTPTIYSPKYTGPITISANKTLQAIAVAPGHPQSQVASGLYTFQTAAPTFSPPPGTYPGPQQVGLSSATPGATIYYTLNNTEPTTASAKYTSPIQVSTNQAILAMAVSPGHTQSSVVNNQYLIQTQAPTFSLPGGTFTTAQTLTMSAVSGATVYFTTNGSVPTTSSTKYSAPITMTSSTTIQAIAVSSGHIASPVVSAVYTFVSAPANATPVVSSLDRAYYSPGTFLVKVSGSGIQNAATVDVSQVVSFSDIHLDANQKQIDKTPVLKTFVNGHAATVPNQYSMSFTLTIPQFGEYRLVVRNPNGHTSAALPLFVAATGYQLPYASGQNWSLAQGNNDTPDHGFYQGKSNTYGYAFDFAMAGTGNCVVAMKGGFAIPHDFGYAQGQQNGYGNYVTIDHGNGEFSHYAHMATGKFAISKQGQQVARGQALGLEGNSGFTLPTGGGYHVHVQVTQTSNIASQTIPFAFDMTGTGLAPLAGPVPGQDVPGAAIPFLSTNASTLSACGK